MSTPAAIYPLLGDDNDPNRIFLVEYSDGRLFLSTKDGTTPIKDRHALAALGSRMVYTAEGFLPAKGAVTYGAKGQ